MTCWEYRVERVEETRISSLDFELGRQGEHGWELVTILDDRNATGYLYLVFKRPSQ